MNRSGKFLEPILLAAGTAIGQASVEMLERALGSSHGPGHFAALALVVGAWAIYRLQSSFARSIERDQADLSPSPQVNPQVNPQVSLEIVNGEDQ